MSNWMSCCHVATDIDVDVIVVRGAFGLLLLGTLAALAIVDFRKMILPNQLNIFLAGAGLFHSLALGQPNIFDAAIGAFIAGTSLWLLSGFYRRVRGVDGLGRGDVKFVTAAGVWTGWQGLPFMLSVASASALTFIAIYSFRTRKFDRMAPLPFGPFLGLGALLSWAAMVTL